MSHLWVDGASQGRRRWKPSPARRLAHRRDLSGLYLLHGRSLACIARSPMEAMLQNKTRLAYVLN